MGKAGGGGKGKGQPGGAGGKADPRAKKVGRRGALKGGRSGGRTGGAGAARPGQGRPEWHRVRPRFVAGPKPWTYPEYRAFLLRVLQPRRSHYGGMGVAKPSAFFDMTDPELFPKVAEVYEEHIEGFSGKSYKKRKSDVDKNMLWRRQLEDKQGRDREAGAGGGAVAGGGVRGEGGVCGLGLSNRQHHKKKKTKPSQEDGEREKLIEAYRLMKANQAAQKARKAGAFGKM